jgi:multidrug efflux system membrane fusion protein
LPQQLAVPIQAIQRGNLGTFVVKVGPQNAVKLVKVNVLGSDGDWQAISTEGDLKPDDTVVTDGADRLRDGSRVDVVNTVQPPLPAALPTPIAPKPAAAKAAVKSPSLTSPAPQAAPVANAPAPAAGSEGARPAWMDRLPPELAAKVQAMTPEERKAFFQRMRERRGGGAP